MLVATREDRKQIDEIMEKVKAQFPSDIVWIRYAIREDWSETPSLFIQVLMNDSPFWDATTPVRDFKPEYFAHYDAIKSVLRKELNWLELFPYISFRTVGERKAIRDSTWD